MGSGDREKQKQIRAPPDGRLAILDRGARIGWLRETLGMGTCSEGIDWETKNHVGGSTQTNCSGAARTLGEMEGCTAKEMSEIGPH
jgi:hypothetical protein